MQKVSVNGTSAEMGLFAAIAAMQMPAETRASYEAYTDEKLGLALANLSRVLSLGPDEGPALYEAETGKPFDEVVFFGTWHVVQEVLAKRGYFENEAAPLAELVARVQAEADPTNNAVEVPSNSVPLH